MRAPIEQGSMRAPGPISSPSVGGLSVEQFRNANLGKYQTADEWWAAYNAQQNGGGLSTYPGSMGQPEQFPQQSVENNEGFPIIGSGPGSPGYEERMRAFMGASTAADRFSPSGGGGGGGGNNQQGEKLGSSTGGLGLSSNLPGLSSNSGPNPSNLTGLSYPGDSQVGYQSPGSAYTGGAPIYGDVGNQRGGLLTMQQTSPQNALQDYYNTPGYQLLNNPNNFVNSPGYQYAVNDALRQVQQNASARGLLESGSALRDMTDRAQGMALQDYGNWWNRQNQQYTDYQNRLAGLAGGPTGADQAYGTGNNLAAGSLQTGNNLASLFGNQGSAGFGGMVNTGAAQANALTGAGNQQAQIGSVNQATLLAGALASNPNRNTSTTTTSRF